ncbi:DUF4124 domain-containing protein [Chitinimonas koreensis]|uniref:DUF4124 domain-containing protein n=1 Tax=Chitinimonas koreensis TaxID=356302 RepID=UPI00040A2329|nr:DUF4124 domain-containing protein [Chitinimonas koreensis]
MRHARRILLAGLAGLLALPAQAITKCTGPDGRVTFTDGACPRNERQSEMAVKVAPGVQVDEAERNRRIDEMLEARAQERSRDQAQRDGARLSASDIKAALQQSRHEAALVNQWRKREKANGLGPAVAMSPQEYQQKRDNRLRNEQARLAQERRKQREADER